MDPVKALAASANKNAPGLQELVGAHGHAHSRICLRYSSAIIITPLNFPEPWIPCRCVGLLSALSRNEKPSIAICHALKEATALKCRMLAVMCLGVQGFVFRNEGCRARDIAESAEGHHRLASWPASADIAS